MAVTKEQIKEFYESAGITLPDYMIDCIVETVNSVEQCMINGNYTACQITMSLSIAAALIGLSMGARKVSSNSVDVISEAYKYESLSDLQDILSNNLRQFDPNGCTDSVIPTKLNPSFLFTVRGCNY